MRSEGENDGDESKGEEEIHILRDFVRGFPEDLDEVFG